MDKKTARFSEDNIFSGVSGIVVNITERKQMELALQESEEKYLGIFNESVAAIYLFDNQKNFIDSNQAGLDLLGYTREKLLKMSIPDVDADPEVVLPEHKKLIAGHKILNYEHQLKRKNGTFITVLNNSRPIIDTYGNVTGMQSTLIDITKRKQAESALKESERKYKILAENAIMPIIIHDLNGYLKYANHRAVEVMKAEDLQELYESPVFKFVHPDDLAATSIAIAKLLDEDAIISIEQRFIRFDGKCIDVEVYGRKTVFDNEKAILVTFNDITERKRTGEELKKKNKELETFNRLAVNRELKMVELKKEINFLAQEAGQEPRYKIAE